MSTTKPSSGRATVFSAVTAFSAPTALALLLAATAARAADAQPGDAQATEVKAAEVCTRMDKPQVPRIRWLGQAGYRVQAVVKDGHVVDLAFHPLGRQAPGEVDEALKGAIADAMHAYECPGDHRFAQEFVFRFSSS